MPSGSIVASYGAAEPNTLVEKVSSLLEKRGNTPDLPGTAVDVTSLRPDADAMPIRYGGGGVTASVTASVTAAPAVAAPVVVEKTQAELDADALEAASASVGAARFNPKPNPNSNPNPNYVTLTLTLPPSDGGSQRICNRFQSRTQPDSNPNPNPYSIPNPNPRVRRGCARGSERFCERRESCPLMLELGVRGQGLGVRS